jgi:hypothetical protein
MSKQPRATIDTSAANKLIPAPSKPLGVPAAIAYSLMMGPDTRLTPEGHPIILCASPFIDNGIEAAIDALDVATINRHRQKLDRSGWQHLKTWNVTKQALERHKNLTYQRVYMFDHSLESERRQNLNISDSCLSWLDRAWYLELA